MEPPVLAVDGTTARRCHERRHGRGALPAVRVWAGAFGLSLGQVAGAEQSTAITALPALRRRVDLRGALLTIDARGTPKAIAEPMIEGEADSVRTGTGNQETWPQAVIDPLHEPGEDDCAQVRARRHPTQETGQGRPETRSSLPMPGLDGLPGLGLWTGLKSIGVVVSEGLRNEKETVEVRSSLSSLGVDVKRFAPAVRSHGGREKSGHGSLDVTDREAESRLREQRRREHWAWLTRFTLALWKQHPGRDSVAMQRRSCGWSDNFPREVLCGARL